MKKCPHLAMKHIPNAPYLTTKGAKESDTKYESLKLLPTQQNPKILTKH